MNEDKRMDNRQRQLERLKRSCPMCMDFPRFMRSFSSIATPMPQKIQDVSSKVISVPTFMLLPSVVLVNKIVGLERDEDPLAASTELALQNPHTLCCALCCCVVFALALVTLTVLTVVGLSVGKFFSTSFSVGFYLEMSIIGIQFLFSLAIASKGVIENSCGLSSCCRKCSEFLNDGRVGEYRKLEKGWKVFQCFSLLDSVISVFLLVCEFALGIVTVVLEIVCSTTPTCLTVIKVVGIVVLFVISFFNSLFFVLEVAKLFIAFVIPVFGKFDGETGTEVKLEDTL